MNKQELLHLNRLLDETIDQLGEDVESDARKAYRRLLEYGRARSTDGHWVGAVYVNASKETHKRSVAGKTELIAAYLTSEPGQFYPQQDPHVAAVPSYGDD